MRKISVIFSVICVLALAGCGGKAADTVAPDSNLYTVSMETFVEGPLTVTYPVLADLSDAQVMDGVNRILKAQGMQALDLFGGETTGISGEIVAEPKLQLPEIISVVYSGVVSVENAVYPINSYYSANVDITTGQQLKLADLVTVNEALLSKFRSGQYQVYSEDLDLTAAGALASVLEGITDEDLLTQLSSKNAIFYLTGDALVISAQVPHVVGDHLEMAIPYADLPDNQTDNTLWTVLLQK